MMVRSFARWIVGQPHPTWTAPALNQFLSEGAYKSSYHNRLGTEVKRFSQHILGQPLDFIHALEPLGANGPRMPEEHAQKLMEGLWKSLQQRPPDPLDVELAFMAQYGCRPHEAAKLLDTRRSTLSRLAPAHFKQLWARLATPLDPG